MNDRDLLLQQIEEFLVRTGWRKSRFGQLAVNDPALVTRLRAGSDVTLGMAQRLRDFMEENEGHGPPRPNQRAVQPAA